MADITLLDGGMGQELIARSGRPAAPLWATQVMLDSPGLVAEVHAAYAAAGASVATTNTYAIHRDRLQGGDSNHYAQDGLELPNLTDRFAELLALAVAETKDVGTRVAGSVGPLGASYRSDIHPSEDEATPIYAEVAKALAPNCDIILFETVASIDAGRACLAAGRQTDRPVWLSFTVDDADGTRLRSGEPITDAVAIARDADAVLINCSAPEVVPAALDQIAKADRPIGAYANGFVEISHAFIAGGSTAEALEARQDLSPAIYADHAMRWLEHGATIVGGCCEVGPAHISEIANRLRAAGHTIV